MDWLQFIAEMTKSLSWPVVVVVGIYMLKENIKLDQLIFYKYKEKDITLSNHDQDVASLSENQNLDHLILSDITDAVREELERSIYDELPSGASKNDKIDVLIGKLAQEQISKEFEKIYHTIFGSQIDILELMSVQKKGMVGVSQIYSIYEQAKKENPTAYQNRSFIDYMNFLVVSRLVTNQDDRWALTRVGRAFLSYITAAQLNKNKRL